MNTIAAEGKPAFDTLVERHGRELHAYLWRMLGNNHDAEDCLQEAFLRAYRAYARLDDGANIRAWLYRIAGNQARTQFRQRRVRFGRERELVQEEAARGPSTEQTVESKLRLEEVRVAVEALPMKQRQALILRKYQEMDYAEIAEVLECSAQAARANVYQALKRLRIRFMPDSQAMERT